MTTIVQKDEVFEKFGVQKTTLSKRSLFTRINENNLKLHWPVVGEAHVHIRLNTSFPCARQCFHKFKFLLFTWRQ